MKILLSSDEVNILVYRYLMENGFIHSSFSFCNEAAIHKNSLWTTQGHKLPPNSLVTFLQKAMIYIFLEYHTNDDTGEEIVCDEPFSLFRQHECSDSKKEEYQSVAESVVEFPVSQRQNDSSCRIAYRSESNGLRLTQPSKKSEAERTNTQEVKSMSNSIATKGQYQEKQNSLNELEGSENDLYAMETESNFNDYDKQTDSPKQVRSYKGSKKVLDTSTEESRTLPITRSGHIRNEFLSENDLGKTKCRNKSKIEPKKEHGLPNRIDETHDGLNTSQISLPALRNEILNSYDSTEISEVSTYIPDGTTLHSAPKKTKMNRGKHSSNRVYKKKKLDPVDEASNQNFSNLVIHESCDARVDMESCLPVRMKSEEFYCPQETPVSCLVENLNPVHYSRRSILTMTNGAEISNSVEPFSSVLTPSMSGSSMSTSCQPLVSWGPSMSTHNEISLINATGCEEFTTGCESSNSIDSRNVNSETSMSSVSDVCSQAAGDIQEFLNHPALCNNQSFAELTKFIIASNCTTTFGGENEIVGSKSFYDTKTNESIQFDNWRQHRFHVPNCNYQELNGLNEKYGIRENDEVDCSSIPNLSTTFPMTDESSNEKNFFAYGGDVKNPTEHFGIQKIQNIKDTNGYLLQRQFGEINDAPIFDTKLSEPENRFICTYGYSKDDINIKYSQIENQRFIRSFDHLNQTIIQNSKIPPADAHVNQMVHDDPFVSPVVEQVGIVKSLDIRRKTNSDLTCNNEGYKRYPDKKELGGESLGSSKEIFFTESKEYKNSAEIPTFQNVPPNLSYDQERALKAEASSFKNLENTCDVLYDPSGSPLSLNKISAEQVGTNQQNSSDTMSDTYDGLTYNY